MLGIEVSKDTLACTLFDPATQKPLWSRSVPNTPAGVNRLLRQTPVESPWALEPTGRYSLLAATQGHQAGRSVLLAQRAAGAAQEGASLSAQHSKPR